MIDRPLIIGVGRPGFGDDAAGPTVVQLVEARGLRADCVPLAPDPHQLAHHWQGRDAVLLVDMCRSDDPDGTLHFIDLHQTALPRRHVATHGLGLDSALALATLVASPPTNWRLIAITGSNVDRGAPMGAVVRAACRRVAADIATWVGHTDKAWAFKH